MDAIVNGKIITGDQLISGKAVIFDSKIIDLVPEEELSQYSIQTLYDARGKYVSPGFIDIHTHGSVGHDTMDGSLEGMEEISLRLSSHGVTGFLPTTMTMDKDGIERALDTVQKMTEIQPRGAKVLGCHLEGPFISPQYIGAQNPGFIQNPNFKIIDRYRGLIKIVTMAPELEGADAVIRQCTDYGIAVSLGHTGGTYEDAMGAIKSGARSITHTFNAMTPLNHRKPGMVGAAMDSEEVYCELIADNIHVHPAVQRILLKVKGIDKVILVTDSMRAGDVGNGVYDLGGQTVIVENGSARLENGALAGSVLTLDAALRNFKRNSGISVAEAVRTVTENPAKLLKLDTSVGSIEIGKAADLVVIDDDFSVFYTLVNGSLQYQRIDGKEIPEA